MNKKELIRVVEFWAGSNSKGKEAIIVAINDFLDQHICIPKGTKPHNSNMELHAWVEDPTLPLEILYAMDYNGNKIWKPISFIDANSIYHIKTPLIEWQWLSKEDEIQACKEYYNKMELK